MQLINSYQNAVLSSNSNNSSFIKLLQQIKINTNIDNAPPAFTHAINTKLQNLNTANLANLQQNLANLACYFTTIAQSQDPSKAAFAALINHSQNAQPDPLTTFKNFSNDQPLLLQEGLQSIITKSWSALLEAAQNHINQIWHTTIIPPYQKMLFNKYPLFKDSKDDISLNDFSKFFGPHGIIDGFFNEYIKPFVNIDRTNWTWKNLNGQKINFSQNSLEVFLRAALIQKMFYSSKALDPKIQFTLTPLDMTPNTQGFTLHLEGQKIIFTNEEKKGYHLVWPGTHSGLITIDFINRQGKYFNTSQFGPWAWFRIIDKSNLTPISNTKHFELTFDLSGNAARYELSAAESINTFVPEIISNFRCPDQLD